MDKGGDEDFGLILEAYDRLPFSEDKLKNTVTFCNYLATLNDMQQIKEGIDKVIDLRNSIPDNYRSFIDPMFKSSLNKIATAKGGEISDYINERFK